MVDGTESEVSLVEKESSFFIVAEARSEHSWS